ncbi:hypothetical protein [Microcoleus sp. B9-D4]|uniref:hypothetical protein n=1 Tax=Microcoleus sp. B9-D4 TaxID=2818711 RepID=UPI002FD692A0
MKPFSFNAKPEEALQIDESLTMTEPKFFNANLNSTDRPFNPLERWRVRAPQATIPISNQSQTIEFEAKFKAGGINFH